MSLCVFCAASNGTSMRSWLRTASAESALQSECVLFPLRVSTCRRSEQILHPTPTPGILLPLGLCSVTNKGLCSPTCLKKVTAATEGRWDVSRVVGVRAATTQQVFKREPYTWAPIYRGAIVASLCSGRMYAFRLHILSAGTIAALM
jgi:hypothetical protein